MIFTRYQVQNTFFVAVTAIISPPLMAWSICDDCKTPLLCIYMHNIHYTVGCVGLRCFQIIIRLSLKFRLSQRFERQYTGS
jgi:hypothetical protein